ncbi:MAG: hypothetical protein JWM11_7439 [Planctomycetaceae bacterium]|nr:hypothetical protein [Planctomycetaceae bacterium]
MMNRSVNRCGLLLAQVLVISTCWISISRPVSGADYFLTIGGGYDRSGNQASLEANVVFFQQVLAERHRGPLRHDIYFADGHDPAADLQILAEKPAKDQAPSKTPATDLLASVHRRNGQVNVTYRNHQVTGISGPLDPALIRADLDKLAKTAQAGDRLIVYVTAHGSEGEENDPFNTTIDCWNERKITAREFTGWLNKLPSKVPVVMVMAQCYCGGFANTIFQDLDQDKGLAPHLRVGFFAQQHDLPAAGCRPDIEHDEEFSSYFWGALAGRSRNGVPIKDCDVDGNGSVSFAEAYAYAVTAGETVDIPLRTSEVALRAFSRLKAAESKDAAGTKENKTAEQNESAQDTKAVPAGHEISKERPALSTMSGTLQSFVDRGRPVSGRIVIQLSKTLGFQLQDDVKVVTAAYDGLRRGGRGRGRRQGSGRRDLIKEITEKWPELGDARKWEKSPLLKLDNQEKLLAELKQLPSWKSFEERLKQRENASQESEKRELREVKFRRLINALETIVLEKNLPQFATPEIVARYQQILALEESFLSPGERRN